MALDHAEHAMPWRRVSRAEDTRLVALAKAGVQSAFDELFRRHGRRVHEFAYHMLHDRDAADDILQSVFVRAHGGLRGFRGKCSFLTWIMRIAVNECISHSRRTRRERARDEAVTPPCGDRLTDDTRQEPHLLVMRQALGRLRPIDRALIVMRDVEGYSYSEIAEAIGSSSNSVGVRLHRARSALREHFVELMSEMEGE